jgi:hypothetical protein
MAEQSRKIDGVDSTVRHPVAVEWLLVPQQRNVDGSVSVIREKWPIVRPDFISAL